MIYLFVALGIFLYFLVGYILLGYAAGLRMDAWRYWDATCAIIFWPAFAMVVIGEVVRDKTRKREDARQDANDRAEKALREL